MISEQFIIELIKQGEGTCVEFKERYAPLDGSEDAKAEFLKDMIAFANTRRQADAYIIVGVRHSAEWGAEIVGQEKHPDQANIQQFLDGKINRNISFEFQVAEVGGKRIGVYRIAKDQPRPIYLKADYKRARAKTAFVRRGSSTDTLTPDEIIELAPSLARTGAWSGEHGGDIREMVNRWFRMFTAHRARQQHIPDLLPQFSIPLDMLTDWRDVARLLQNRDLVRATCRLFNVNENWLTSGFSQIYHPLFINNVRALDRIFNCFEENMAFDTDGDLLVFQDGDDPLGPPYRRWAAALIRVPIAWFAEIPVYRYTTLFIDRWEDVHERKAVKLAMLAARELHFNIKGYTLKPQDLEALRHGMAFPDELMPHARAPWTGWHVISKHETPDMEELIELQTRGEGNGFLPDIRRLEETYRLKQSSVSTDSPICEDYCI
ncbi:MAG TPA: ATP-binding protein [Bryobacteraceae bacterium]|jgi:hypothetical protein